VVCGAEVDRQRRSPGGRSSAHNRAENSHQPFRRRDAINGRRLPNRSEIGPANTAPHASPTTRRSRPDRALRFVGAIRSNNDAATKPIAPVSKPSISVIEPHIPKMHQSVRAHDSPSQAAWTSTMRHGCQFLSVEATIYANPAKVWLCPARPHRVQSSRSRTPSAGARRETNGRVGA
jgi:hypothetical protein